VLVVQVDVVGAEPLEGALDRCPRVVRVPVQGAAAVAAAVREQPELRRDHHVVAAAGQGAAEQFLVLVRTVDLRGVEQGHPELDGAVDGADRLGVVGVRTRVEGRHAHAAEPQARHLETGQRYLLHECALSEGVTSQVTPGRSDTLGPPAVSSPTHI
jgi:hypothetical protein